MAVGGILLPVVVMKEQRAKGQDLSRWLQEKRRQDGLSLREIARMTDLSHGTVAGILRGVRSRPETLEKLARGFGGGSTLQDQFLEMAGYRKQRRGRPSVALAELIDKATALDDHQVRMLVSFAEIMRDGP